MICRALTFPGACIAAEYVLIGFILLSPTHLLGCHLKAAATVLFAAIYTPVYVGCLVISSHSVFFQSFCLSVICYNMYDNTI